MKKIIFKLVLMTTCWVIATYIYHRRDKAERIFTTHQKVESISEGNEQQKLSENQNQKMHTSIEAVKPLLLKMPVDIKVGFEDYLRGQNATHLIPERLLIS